MVNGESPFYLAVNNLKFKSLGTKNWLKANAVGINKIGSLMKTMDQQAGFENNRLRNHSSRKTMIYSAQQPINAAVPPISQCFLPCPADTGGTLAVAASEGPGCFFCGNNKHFSFKEPRSGKLFV